MTPHRAQLLSILSSLEQAETVSTQLLRLDAGPPIDSLAEVLGKVIEDTRKVVQQLLGE
jgi:hypothetical protein